MLHMSKKYCTFAASKVKGEKTMDDELVIKYHSEEERLEALRKMVGMRKIFEARAREIYQQRYGVAVAQ